MDGALIHRARLAVVRQRGARNADGEYETSGVPGPWFPARLMERGGVAAERRRRANSTDARVARGYELLAGPRDETGAPVVLDASCRVITACAILGSPTLDLDGEPEKLTNGVDHIGWLCLATKVKDAA